MARRPFQYVSVFVLLALLPAFAPHPTMSSVAEVRRENPLASGGMDRWVPQCVDCSKDFYDMSDRSMRLDSQGYPHIAYGGDHLYYAWHDATAWHYEMVDDAPGVGRWASLDLDGTGHPHIAYYDERSQDLKCAHRSDSPGSQEGSGWQIEIVDSAGNIGRHSSLATDGDGHLHVGYYNATDGDLRYAYKGSGGEWHAETVDSEGDAGQFVSLAVDGSGYPHISYTDDANHRLRYAYQDASG